MASKRKLPKKPKRTASLNVWQNWEKRAKAVIAHNKKLIADKKKKEALIQRLSKLTS